MKRDSRTITQFFDDPLKKTVRWVQGKMKALSTRELSRVTRQLKKKSKGKVFYGQEPPSGESTTTECGVNYQLLAVITEVAQWGTPSCSRPQQLRTMASEAVDPIDWSHPHPHEQYPPSDSCKVQIGATQPQPGFDLATLQPSACEATTLPVRPLRVYVNIHWVASKKAPITSSTIIFRNAGLQNISKSIRCRVLRTLAKHVKPEVWPPLKDIHKEKRMAWAKKYLKLDFQHVLFTDECRATLDGPDGWSKIWVPNGALRPHRLRR